MCDAFAAYLKPYAADVRNHYLWSFNEAIPRERFDITLTGPTSFDRTLDLKRKLTEKALQAHDADMKAELASYVIRDWGGIRRFSKASSVVKSFATLEGSPTFPTDQAVTFPFEGISSWSKWLSIVWPEWALIYDARVAYSLNAISYLTETPARIFPLPSGRNTKMKILDSSTLLLAARLQKDPVETAEEIKTRHFVPMDAAYETYLGLVKATHARLWSDQATPLVHTEMLLFSLADTVIFNDLVKSTSRRV